MPYLLYHKELFIATYFFNFFIIFHQGKVGWDSWIRTNEMPESKSGALPLGYTPLLALRHFCLHPVVSGRGDRD